MHFFANYKGYELRRFRNMAIWINGILKYRRLQTKVAFKVNCQITTMAKTCFWLVTLLQKSFLLTTFSKNKLENVWCNLLAWLLNVSSIKCDSQLEYKYSFDADSGTGLLVVHVAGYDLQWNLLIELTKYVIFLDLAFNSCGKNTKTCFNVFLRWK